MIQAHRIRTSVEVMRSFILIAVFDLHLNTPEQEPSVAT